MSRKQNKQYIARLVSWTPIRILMGLAVRIMIPRQRVGVALVGFDDDGRILMLNHVYHPTARWGLPGGWLDRDEAPAECALRELKEETGLTAILGPVVYLTHERVPPHIGIAYMARIMPGETRLSSEIISADWFLHDALPAPILPFTRDAIRSAVSFPNRDFVNKREWDE